MDPISEACLSSNTQDKSYQQILGSCISITPYQRRNFKNLVPQISAALLVTSYHLVTGISLAYSAILIPQLQLDEDFKLNKNDKSVSWIASVITLTSLLGSLIVGVLMDRYGRLSTVRWASLPGVAGWVAIALAKNVPVIILGRALTGFSNAFGSNPAIVYVTEIARKDMRGSLFSFAPALASFGITLTFILGWLLTWRQVAWICSVISFLPAVLLIFVPESPVWLVSKNRYDEAKESLTWLNRFQPQPINKHVSVAEMQLALLSKERELKLIEESKSGGVTFRDFFKPTVYKPFIIITGLYFLHQFSGIFIFLFHSITFFQEVGTKVNPYLASIFIGVLRFIICLSTAYIFKRFKKRHLLITSALGVSFSAFMSGLFGFWIKNGTTTLNWMPVVFLLLFIVFSMLGLAPIPHIIAAEVFPVEIRGVTNSIARCVGNLAMFTALYIYPILLEGLGGIVGLLYFFSATALACIGYVYVLVPETQGVNLYEIERYFRSNFIYLGHKKNSQKKLLPLPQEELVLRISK